MVKINYRKNLFKGRVGLCESVLCAPFEDPELFKEEDFENGRFDEACREGKKFLEFSDISKSDYVIIPYKWDGRTPQNLEIIQEANSFGKKVIALHNDDYKPASRIEENEGYLFTTTLEKSSQRKNEFSIPAFCGDFFEKYNSGYVSSQSIGFCGAITHPIRSYVLNAVKNEIEFLNKDYLIRNSFWASNEMSKDDARVGYFKNMTENTYILCMRGAGNFSYRFFETMMMGRIPIIIDSNQVFPFDTILDYNNFGIVIPQNNIHNLKNIIYEWVSSKTDKDIIDIQKNNRRIWIEYMSPLGWIKNFNREIKK